MYYLEVSNEELVRRFYANEKPEEAFRQLIINNRRTMIKIGMKYLSKIPIYDIDDYVQEGSILNLIFTSSRMQMVRKDIRFVAAHHSHE